MYLYDYKIAGLGDLAWYENVYKEIWFDHEYSRYGIEVKKDDVKKLDGSRLEQQRIEHHHT